MPENPLVSVVIPTRNRPLMVCRAVNSALDQTFRNIEVVVVVDGPDVPTVGALTKIEDRRLRVVILDQPAGGASARNHGAQYARGEWIALLDDDDEWLPNKIDCQLLKAMATDCREPIITSRFVAHTSSGDHIWPEELLRENQPISEYLLVRKGLKRSEGFIATPTIMARRSLLLRLPFKPNLKRHQDWDWVLRASAEESVKVIFCAEPLVICHMTEPTSVSRNADWHFSWEWIRNMKPQITRRAYASFVLCHVAWQAAAQRAWGAFLPLLFDATLNGPPSLGDLTRYAGFWFVPVHLRRRLMARLS